MKEKYQPVLSPYKPECWLVRSDAICLVSEKAVSYMSVVMTLVSLSLSGTFLNNVRRDSHKHTVDFLSVHTT